MSFIVNAAPTPTTITETCANPPDCTLKAYDISQLEVLFTNIVSLAVGFAGIALFAMLLIGGFNLLTAGGDANKAQAGQKTITWAIGGLVFIVVSFLIIRLISSFTGVESILEFRITQDP